MGSPSVWCKYFLQPKRTKTNRFKNAGVYSSQYLHGQWSNGMANRLAYLRWVKKQLLTKEKPQSLKRENKEKGKQKSSACMCTRVQILGHF